MKMTIVKEDGVTHLRGPINEHADFSSLKDTTPPLKLDLKRVTDMSSAGTRRWMLFLKVWGAKPLELYGCPPPLVNLFNAIPMALGITENLGNVKSLMVPFSCVSCNTYQETEVVLRSLQLKGGAVVVPQGLCAACGEPTRLIPDPDDYFLFLTSAGK